MKALDTVLNNSDIYTVTNRFIDMSVINDAQSCREKLTAALKQYKVAMEAQKAHTPKLPKLLHNASMYISHFLQVLMMAVERGEIRENKLPYYGLEEGARALPQMNTADSIIEWGAKAIEGEKQRLKQGGRPIYNPTIGMVSTHYDIFHEELKQQKYLVSRVGDASQNLADLRPHIDEVLLEMWNQIEAHFAELPPEKRFNACREYGVVYYYRRHEPHVY